jgi:hypothetical protein
MKKKLNIESITNELEGASLFFPKPVNSSTPPPSKSQVVDSPSAGPEVSSDRTNPPIPKRSATKNPRKKNKGNYRDTTTPRHHATMVSRYHDTIISIVRSAVRQLGKEAATHRFTEEEKRGIADVIYTYKNQGVRTSENEITRIAVNFIIQDYKEHGEESVLDKVLKALND